MSINATTIHHYVLLLLSTLFFSGFGGKLQQEAIQAKPKLHYQDIQVVRDTYAGGIPNVDPTMPGNPGTNPINPPTITGPAWCVANPNAAQTALQVALDYACGYGGADCSEIQLNGACYNPNTIHDHASYAFNDYYQNNPISTSCDFGGTAQLVYTDPGQGNCRYASPTSTPTTPPTTMPPTIPTPTPTMPMTPPAIPMTPPSTTMPGDTYPTPMGDNGYGSEPTGDDYGAEPTGTPNSAGSLSLNMMLFITLNCIILSAIATNIPIRM